MTNKSLPHNTPEVKERDIEVAWKNFQAIEKQNSLAVYLGREVPESDQEVGDLMWAI